MATEDITLPENDVGESEELERPDYLLLVAPPDNGYSVSCLDLVRSLCGVAVSMEQSVPPGLHDLCIADIDRIHNTATAMRALSQLLLDRVHFVPTWDETIPNLIAKDPPEVWGHKASELGAPEVPHG